MSDSSFPEWVPGWMVEHYLQMLQDDEEDEDADPSRVWAYGAPGSPLQLKQTFYKLMTSPQMATAWPKIVAYDDKTKPPFSVSFAFMVAEALHRKSEWETLTPVERKTVLEKKIITPARQLSTLIKKYDLGKNLLRYFSDEELIGMQLFLSLYGWETDEAKIADAASSLPSLPKSRGSIIKSTPSLHDLLERLASDLEENPPYEPAMLKKPGAKNSEYAFFLKKMHRHNMRQIGQPLWEVLADVASVFFPKEAPNKDSVISLVGK